MEQMIVWWGSLSDILRVLYCMAVPSTLLLVIQTLRPQGAARL